MSVSVKRDLLNYLEYLKESGYLYLETGGVGAPTPPPESAPPKPPIGPSEPQVEPAMKPPPKTASRRPDNPAKPPRPSAPAVQAVDLFGGVVETEPEADREPGGGTDAGLAGENLPREERIASLQAAIARAEACRACELGCRRNKLVYGDGDAEAPIVFVGEAPGGEEDATGIPFVGRAGQLLNKIIAAMGFRREEVYICNTLKCRPPGNRDPEPGEKEACEPFLIEQLQVLRPTILVALGAHAAQYLCRSDQSIGRLRGRWHRYQGIPLRATYHPAFLLRSPSFKSRTWEDFQAIHAKYGELNPDDPREIWQGGI